MKIKLVKPSTEFVHSTPDALKLMEAIGRTCYKSEERITENSAGMFMLGLMKRGHLSVIEHASVTVKFIVDRGVSHELVRHRLASFSQESTRYCNYKDCMTFVIPPWLDIKAREYDPDELFVAAGGCYRWFCMMATAAVQYEKLLEGKWSPQQARSVLPNSLKTEVVMTANMREWAHVFHLRTAEAAHPQMYEVMRPLCKRFQELWPEIFEGITWKGKDDE